MTPFIVAEMSANHLGSFERALRIVEAAAQAGADAIKLQTWTPGTMCVSDYVLDRGPWKGRTLRSLYEEAHTPWSWHKPIFKAARDLGLVPFSAAFDRESVDFLDSLGVDRHKVASFEITDIPLIRYMASREKPIIFSGGAASQEDLVHAASAAWKVPRTYLRCVSEYPARPEDFNLTKFAANEGLSDHSLGIEVAVEAAAQGACYIEKHLTLRRSDGGPDAGFSMEPWEFAEMVKACKEPPVSLGRSLWVVEDIPAGRPLMFGLNVRTARPALGVHCGTTIEGYVAARDLKANTPLTADCIATPEPIE